MIAIIREIPKHRQVAICHCWAPSADERVSTFISMPFSINLALVGYVLHTAFRHLAEKTVTSVFKGIGAGQFCFKNKRIFRGPFFRWTLNMLWQCLVRLVLLLVHLSVTVSESSIPSVSNDSPEGPSPSPLQAILSWTAAAISEHQSNASADWRSSLSKPQRQSKIFSEITSALLSADASFVSFEDQFEARRAVQWLFKKPRAETGSRRPWEAGCDGLHGGFKFIFLEAA